VILECRSKPWGIGYARQAWPKAHHHITRVGTREVRVIVEHGETPTVPAILGLLVAGLLLRF
jgi:hypothetical protein